MAASTSGARKEPSPKILVHGEVHKRIVEKPPTKDYENDLLGPFDRYRDEDVRIYKEKRAAFLKTADHFRRLSEETLIRSNDAIGDYKEPFLNFDYEKEPQETKQPHADKGVKIRKRFVREIHQDIKFDYQPCSLEPWFKRHLTLGRFIQVGRKVILHNRLLRNLEILKKVTPEMVKELDKKHRCVLNVSYAELFEKFLSTAIPNPYIKIEEKEQEMLEIISRVS